MSTESLSPPPPQSRHRASSTNIRPALTISTLGTRRRCSFSCPLESPAINAPPLSQVQTEVPPVLVLDNSQTKSPSMFVVFLSRCFQLFSVKHSSVVSSPPSPRSSTDDLVLPLSASSHQTTFGDVFSEKTSTRSSNAWWQGAPSVHAPILFVITLFPLSTALVLFCLSTLPISLSWPRTLTDLAELGGQLHGYSQSSHSSMAHVIGVLSITAVWKHAWSIPGSVIWNVLAGALFSPAYATLLLTTLTTIGSLCATLLATPLSPFLTHFFPRALDMTRNALEGASDLETRNNKSKSSAWVRLSVLRLIGVVPWSGINIACGVCGVPIADCILGSFIGTLPWTAVTCQIGDILQTVASAPSPTPQTVSSLLTSPDIIIKLALLSFISLAPILGRKHLRALISHSSDATDEERPSRWAWVKDWKSRLASRSRTRKQEESRSELEILIREKQSLP